MAGGRRGDDPHLARDAVGERVGGGDIARDDQLGVGENGPADDAVREDAAEDVARRSEDARRILEDAEFVGRREMPDADVSGARPDA